MRPRAAALNSVSGCFNRLRAVHGPMRSDEYSGPFPPQKSRLGKKHGRTKNRKTAGPSIPALGRERQAEAGGILSLRLAWSTE